MLDIFVDADGCPVKQEIFQVARKRSLRVTVVSNSHQRVPPDERFVVKVVGAGFDAADDWIAEQIGESDLVITSDIPLAARCLEKGALALAPDGREFTPGTIGELLASRDLMAELREMGVATGGPKPFTQRERSNFLHQLQESIGRIQRGL